MQKVIAEISRSALRANAKTFKKRCHVPLCAVVKADAYGHGAIGVVEALQGVADYFAVALLEEAIAIKIASAGKEIWILSYIQQGVHKSQTNKMTRSVSTIGGYSI